MKCPLCGEEVSKDDLYCGNCGYNLLQDQAEPTPSEEVPSEEVVQPAEEALEAGTEKEKAEAPFELPEESKPPRAAGQARNKTWIWIVVIVAILLVLLCCCCLTMLYFVGWLAQNAEPTSWLLPGLM